MAAVAAVMIGVTGASLAASPGAAPARAKEVNSSAAVGPAEARKLAAEVQREFLHAWSHYRRAAWGHDELRPLSNKPNDWYGQSLLMTPVDGLDTLLIMGRKREVG